MESSDNLFGYRYKGSETCADTTNPDRSSTSSISSYSNT